MMSDIFLVHTHGNKTSQWIKTETVELKFADG